MVGTNPTSTIEFLFTGTSNLYSLFFKSPPNDSIAVAGTTVIIILALLSFIWINGSSLNAKERIKRNGIHLLLILNLVAMVSATNLMSLYIFIFLFLGSLMFYVQAHIPKESRTLESIGFYFFITHLSFMLMGLALIFGSSVLLTDGQVTFDFVDIKQVASELVVRDRLFLMGHIFVLVPMCSLFASFPFHMWWIKLYHRLDLNSLYVLITAVQAGFAFVLLKVLSSGVLKSSFALNAGMQWLSVLTTVFGAILILSQKQIKDLLATFSVFQAGVIMSLIFVSGYDPDHLSVLTSMVGYILINGVLIWALLIGLKRVPLPANKSIELKDLNGLYSEHKALSIFLAIVLLSLSGMAPFFGFFIKVSALFEVLESGHYWLFGWTLVGAVLVGSHLIHTVFKFFLEDRKSGKGF